MLNTGYGWIESKYNHMGLLFSDKKKTHSISHFAKIFIKEKYFKNFDSIEPYAYAVFNITILQSDVYEVSGNITF